MGLLIGLNILDDGTITYSLLLEDGKIIVKTLEELADDVGDKDLREEVLVASVLGLDLDYSNDNIKKVEVEIGEGRDDRDRRKVLLA